MTVGPGNVRGPNSMFRAEFASGRYGPPKSNEEYGTKEAPLIQQNGDPLCDLLYRVRNRGTPVSWFRAFDYGRWDYWASNADAGWGAWSVETGWTQSWIASLLAMRHLKTSLWQLTAGSRIARHLGELLPLMIPDGV